MRRLLLALLIVPFAVHATTTTFTSCTAGTITATPCQGMSTPSYTVNASATANETPLGTIFVSEQAAAYYTPCPNCPPEVPLSATTEAIVNDTDYTTGPIRSGFITVNFAIGSLRGLFQTGPAVPGDEPGWAVGAGPYLYGGCIGGSIGLENCAGSATLPFELGIPFQVFVTSPGGVTLFPGEFVEQVSENDVSLAFSLFESDGTTPVPFFAAPEPATYGLLLCGCIALLIRVARLSRTKGTLEY